MIAVFMLIDHFKDHVKILFFKEKERLKIPV